MSIGLDGFLVHGNRAERAPLRGPFSADGPMFVRKGFGTACVENLDGVTPDGRERLGEAPERWWA